MMVLLKPSAYSFTLIRNPSEPIFWYAMKRSLAISISSRTVSYNAVSNRRWIIAVVKYSSAYASLQLHSVREAQWKINIHGMEGFLLDA